MSQSLVFTKPDCQAFACLEISKQTGIMKTADIRRAQLKAWFADRSLPEREKSYISQLISGKASFGEKAARRLENDYGMPDRYLDQSNVLSANQDRQKYSENAEQGHNPEEIAVLSAYRRLERQEQLLILKMLDIKPIDFAKSA